MQRWIHQRDLFVQLTDMLVTDASFIQRCMYILNGQSLDSPAQDVFVVPVLACRGQDSSDAGR